MSYAIQRTVDGQYESDAVGVYVRDAHRAFSFCTRQAAQDYIARYRLRGHVAVTLPDTRPLLTAPMEKSA